MDAIDKTKSLQRIDISSTLIDPDPRNPNKMNEREFNLLIDNLSQTGLTDAILVRPSSAKKGRYIVVGGHHRLEGAKFLGFEKVPCTVITDPAFDDEAATFQMVRMNVIRGKMTPDGFFKLYNEMQSKYSDQMLQDMFGFAEEEEFRKLVIKTTNSIADPTMKAAFKDAAKEVKTIDGLAKLLNEMFTKYGDSVPFGFMVFEYGGQNSIWLQVTQPTIAAFTVVGQICREHMITVDDLIGNLVQMIAKGELKASVAKLIAQSAKVAIPAHLQTLPTKQNIEDAVKVA